MQVRAQWFSGRALLLHLAVVLVAPACAVAAWWQVQRALSGNTLSWAYVFEWPAFAGLAVWAWWVLVHAGAPGTAAPVRPATAGRPRASRRERLLEQRRVAPCWSEGDVGPRLREYDAYLLAMDGLGPSEARRLPRPAGGGRD